MEHKFTIVVIAAVLTSLLLAGTILAPIQSYAAGSRGGFPNTSTLKQAVRDGVSVNLEHRDQHMNQENLCYRANTCRQSDVGQNTLGNDNSITGFADQSDNLQQSAAAPITPTGNQTTGNQTGGGGTTPTTGTLLVKKVEVCVLALCPVISDFTITVTGNNPTPSTFPASVSGTLVTLGPGPVSVTETGLVVAGFIVTLSADCTGTIVAGDQKTCTITNTQRQT